MGADLQKRMLIFAGSVLAALLFLGPTFKPDFFSKGWVSKPISLGLDLSGGVHLVYEVITGEAVKSRLQTMANLIRSELRKEKIAVTKATVSDKGQIEFILLSETSLEKAQRKIEESFRELSLIEKGSEGGRPKIIYGVSAAAAQKIEANSVQQAVETLRARIDQFGVAEPLIQRVGETRIMLQMPGVSDIASVKKVVGSVAKLEFRLVPQGTSEGSATIKDRDGQSTKVEEEVLMSGDAVDSASVGNDETGRISVLLSMTSEGARNFRKITAENVNRQLAIVLDGVLYSAPEIREEIPTGHASITGSFTYQEAHELAVVLRAGALPAPLKVLEERTVGPTLGKESIKKGVTAIVVGFFAIVIFLIFYYGKAGAVAVVTLALNLLFVLALLSAFGATLTLPGLAGLALTIGMAVDSNVIIFERIRDEIGIGATRDAAVAAGFNKALSAIVDSNITTLAAAAVLYYFGTGPIRGFAVTLSIGILTTIYCATFVTRLIFDYLPLQGRKGLSI